ncbi:MAG: glycosyltransferase, partial [Acidobacteria bacterium]|nr:glycosyltransferase [Acidobacteriota bacterium]
AFEPVVVCPGGDSLFEMVSELGVPVETVASLEARFTWRVDHLAHYCRSFFRVILGLRNRVTTIKPDLIHANSIRAGLVATAATLGLGTQVIWHLHDLLPRHPLSTWIRLFALFATRARMIAVSEAVGRNFRGRLSHLLKNRVSVILNAIDLERFQFDPAARRRIRKELRVRETDPLVGIVGQITPRKGQLELMRAFAQARNEIPHTVLLVAGAPLFNRDHEYLKAVERAAVELGIRNNVRLLGARNDIGAVMQALDLLIVNSAAEPFGLVILEAMACGTPVLAAAVDGIPEIIEHNKNGWLVPARDEGSLAAEMVHLSSRPEVRAQLAERGRRHVNARFSSVRYLTQLQAFYLKCADRAALYPAASRSGDDLLESTRGMRGQGAAGQSDDWSPQPTELTT